MADIGWLLRDASLERRFTVGERMVADDAQWRATIERVDIAPTMRVFLTDVETRREVAIEPRSDRRDNHWIASQVTIVGQAEIEFPTDVWTHASPEHALLFRSPEGRATYRLEPGKLFKSAGYTLDLERVVRLFDGDVPRVLQPLLVQDPSRCRIVEMPGDRSMRRLAGSLFARGLNGPLRLLTMEGAVLQLLAAQITAAERRPLPRRRRGFSLAERDALQAARQRLLVDMRNPPSLGEIAVEVGLTEKRLNAGFRALFGTTAFEALRSERLEHARIALQSGEVALKEVAFRVGYNHVSNFVSAYASRFGAPPRAHQRRQITGGDDVDCNGMRVRSTGTGD